MELDLNIDSNGNVIVNTLSEYVAYISQLQAANEGSNERFFFRGQSNKNWDVRPCLFSRPLKTSLSTSIQQFNP